MVVLLVSFLVTIAPGHVQRGAMRNLTFSGSPPGLSEATDCAVRQCAWAYGKKLQVLLLTSIGTAGILPVRLLVCANLNSCNILVQVAASCSPTNFSCSCSLSLVASSTSFFFESCNSSFSLAAASSASFSLTTSSFSLAASERSLPRPLRCPAARRVWGNITCTRARRCVVTSQHTNS